MQDRVPHPTEGYIVKRSIRVVAGLGLAAGLALGASPAAQASTGHHHKTKTCHTGCHHAPKPPGGWPCSATHSCPPPKPCPPRHHHPKPKPPVQPPTQVTPKPPIHSTPRTPAKPSVPSVPAAHYATPATPAAAAPSLPRTGGLNEGAALAGLLLLGVGVPLTRVGRGSKWTVK